VNQIAETRESKEREMRHPSNSVSEVKASIEIEGAPKGEWKALGGSDHDKWNNRLSRLVLSALPINLSNESFIRSH
jgi:hypothetical protein